MENSIGLTKEQGRLVFKWPIIVRQITGDAMKVIVL